ncbi:acyl-CoA thioester hydrolase [Aliiruegeria haliotis]|uniref:Acyl-CoA thioester hydrolase n=1 Tax=Aliiruegeria haliotis TaxID=1280846 RepID=A0A2T0RN85_9RHOB|nr:tol-pal system-associated acyl-CoA thioesterase [Aliiruegeria haliotis]PRY22654.1 acyl-CoA thioester hydrolase [Aliiruegeria haliotis]
MAHTFDLRVYYEDTDMAGIVYHANYLKFIERGRSTWVREIGIDQNRLREEEGKVFVVRHMEIDFLAPARYEDVLTVETELVAMKASSFTVEQRVLRADRLLFKAQVQAVCMTLAGRPVRLPDLVCDAFAK